MLPGAAEGMMGDISVCGEVAREYVPVAFATHPALWRFLVPVVGGGHLMETILEEMWY